VAIKVKVWKNVADAFDKWLGQLLRRSVIQYDLDRLPRGGRQKVHMLGLHFE